MEFVNSREIMPLFLVEQNGQHQHPIEGQLPSLPSSKSSSRTSSPVKNPGPDEKDWEVVEPIQDGNVEEESKPESSTVIPSQEPASSQDEQPKSEPSTVIPQEIAASQAEQSKADLSTSAQDSDELEKEGEGNICRELEAGEPIDEPLPPLPSSHGSLNASVEDLSVVPDVQSWKVLDLTHDMHPKEEAKPDLTTRSEERRGEEDYAKEIEKPETQEPIDEPLPSLPSSHSSLNSPARNLETDPNEKNWKAFNLTQDVHPKEEVKPGPSPEPSGEEELKEKDKDERDIQKVEAQAPIDEQFPSLPPSNGSLNTSVEDLSAVPDEQTRDPADLTGDTPFEEQLKPEPSISTPALQSEDRSKPSSPIINPSCEPTDGDKTEEESGAKDISEKALTQEPVNVPLSPLPLNKGSSLNASVENLVPGEEDWNPIDLTQAVHEEQPEFGLSFREPVDDDGEKENEKAKAPEPIDGQLPPLPSNGSSLNASVEYLRAVPGEDSWDMVDQPDVPTSIPSQEPVRDPDSQPEEKPKSELSITFPFQEPAMHQETQPEDHQQFGQISSQETVPNQDPQPENRPKSELTIKFPSQEPALNQEAQPEKQSERGLSMTPHYLEPILEEAEDEAQPNPSTTIPSQPALNQDAQVKVEPRPDSSITISQEPSDDDLEKEKEKDKEIEKALPDAQQEPPIEETAYKDPTSPEIGEKDTSGWKMVESIQNALPEEQAEPDFSSTAPSQQPARRQDAQLDRPRGLSATPFQEAAGKEELKEKGKEKATDFSDAQQEQPTRETVEKDIPPPYESHEEDEAVNPHQEVRPEPQRKPSLSIAIPSQDSEDELEEKYAKAREKDTDFHEFDTIDEEWTASEIMRERERHKHEFDIHSPAELLWDPHKYFITPRPFGGTGSRSFGGSLAPRSYEPPKIQDDDIDISDPDEDISPPKSGPSGLPEKEISAPESAEMTASIREEKSENSEDMGIAGTRDEEEQPKKTIPETRHAHVGEDKAIVPDIELTPPIKDAIVPTVPVTAPKEEEQTSSTPDFGGVADATVAAAVNARESHPTLEAQSDAKEDEPAVPEGGVARDLPVEPKGDLNSEIPPAEESTATTELDFLDASQQSEDGQEPYRTLSPIMEEPDLESERSQSVDIAHDEQTPTQESEEMESAAPTAEDKFVSREPLDKQYPVPEVEPAATAPETERGPGVITENVQNTGEASQEAQPSDEAQSVTTETATSRDGYAESTQDSGTDFWDAVEKHEEGEGSIASSLDRPIDTSEPPTPREWRTEASFEPEVPAQDVHVSPAEEFSRSTPVEEERQDARTKPEDQLLEKTGNNTQAPIEAQDAISRSGTACDELQRQIEPAVADSEQVPGKLPEKAEQLIANEPEGLVKSALEVNPEAAADIETLANAAEKFPQAKSKEEYEKDRKFFSSLEPLTETEAEHFQSVDAAAGAGTFETSGEVPATDARHQSPEPAGARDVELVVPAASESELIAPVEKLESNIAAHGPLSLKAEQTPASALSEPGTTPEDKQEMEDSGERSKHGFPSATLDNAASIELPPSRHAEIAEVDVPTATSDILPSSVTPTEEPNQKQLIEREMPRSIADSESLADVVTAAQEGKEKKERRKEHHAASLDESVPATPQDETASIDEIFPVKAPSVEEDNDIAHEPTEVIPEQPRDDVPPADIEHTQTPETSVEQNPPKSDAPIYPEATSVQGPIAEAEPIQEKAQDESAPTVETSGTTGEPTVTEPKLTQEERDITASMEPVSTSSGYVEEAPKEDPAVNTDVTASAQNPTVIEPSSAKDVPQDDAVHAQDQTESAATVTENFQELPSLEKNNEEAPVTEPPSRTNSKKNKKKHRRSASSEVKQPTPAEDVTDTPSIDVSSEAPAASQATEEKPVESPVTETQKGLHPTMSKKQAKRERKKRRSMGQSPDELPVESAQPTAVHEAPAQVLQQQAPAQKDDESIAQEVQHIKEKEEAKSDLKARPFESKEAGLLSPTSEAAQVKEPEGSTLHPAGAEDTSSLPGDAKNKVRHHRRRRSRILEQLAEAEAERERAKQASTKENPTGTLPVTESKPTAPVEDSGNYQPHDVENATANNLRKRPVD